MQENSKFFLVGIVCLLLGAGGFYAWTQLTPADQKSQLITTEQTANQVQNTDADGTAETDTQTPDAQTEEAAAEKPVAMEEGGITGVVGYPSEGIPPLTVYAINQNDNSIFFSVGTQENQQEFTITSITPGTYVVVAYPQDGAGLTGGYTQAVPCGLSVACTDHSLIPVIVNSGEVSLDIMVKDWYAPAGQFPAKPE